MIELRCLGSIDLKAPDPGSANRVIAQPKRYALLAYLALAAPRGFHRRDKLIALFWPESDDEHARSGLRIALSFLRRELGEDVIVTRGDDVAVSEIVRSDVAEFESALRAGELEQALTFYYGNLLPGFHVSMSPDFEQWLDVERERLKQCARDAAVKLAAKLQDAGDPKSALKWTRFALDLAPDDEGVVQRLIRLFDRTGDRAGALRTYELFAERMKAEFDAEPSPETAALVATIRARSDVVADPSPKSIAQNGASVSGYVTQNNERPTKRSRVSVLAVGILALFAVSSASAVLWKKQPHRSPRMRIAIVAPQNQTGRADLDYVGSMVADEIAAKVGDRWLGDVVTLPATAATKLTPLTSADPARHIAEETGARLVITGAYTAEADTLLLRVEVADAARNRLLAVIGPVSFPLSKASEGIAVTSAQVLSSVARALEPRLAGIIEQRGWSRPVPFEGFKASSQGFELFLTGKSRDDYEKAIDLFAKAYSLDSTELNALFEMAIIEQSLEEWARADSLLARTSALRARMSEGETNFLDFLLARNRGDHRAAYEFARRQAERLPGAVWEYDAGYHALSSGQPALAVKTMSALNPDSGFLKGVWAHRGVMAEAYHVMGDNESELALARIQRDKQPELLSTALYEARALAALGKMRELQTVIRESEALAPQSGLIPALPPLRGLSSGSIMLESAIELRAHGRAQESRALLERAVAWYQKHLHGEPQSALLQEGLGEALYASGSWPAAEALFDSLARRDPQNVDYQGYLGLIAAHEGRRSDAAAAAKALAQRNETFLFGRPKLWRARIAAQLGDLDSAISLLRESLREGVPFGIGFHRDSDLELLRGLPAFREFIEPRG